MTLDELSELAKRATPGPWKIVEDAAGLSPALVLALVEVAKGAQASLNQRWPNGVSCGVQNLSCAVITALDNDLEQALSKLSNLSREG